MMKAFAPSAATVSDATTNTSGLGIVVRDQRFLKFVTDYEYECNTAECRKNLNATRSRAVSHPGTTHYEYNTSFY